MFYCLDLDDNDPIKLYPRVELVENKEVSDFSIICTRERAMYYSSKSAVVKKIAPYLTQPIFSDMQTLFDWNFQI